jgi:IS5 family transposase
VVDKKTRKVICTAFANGKKHDFRLYKESGTHMLSRIQVDTDTGYQGIKALHANSIVPKKKSKKHPLSTEEKAENRRISRERVSNEHAIGFIKRFRILAERYRNRRKRFRLRFNLIAGICNYDLDL